MQVVQRSVRIGNHDPRAMVAVLHKALGTLVGTSRGEIEFGIRTGRHLLYGNGFLSADFPDAQVQQDWGFGAVSGPGEICGRDLLSVRRETRTDEPQEFSAKSLGRELCLKCGQLRRQIRLSVDAGGGTKPKRT